MDRGGAAGVRTATTGRLTTAAGGLTFTGLPAPTTLVRTGSATHTVDTDQRRIPLTPVSSEGSAFRLKLPASAGTVVPGNYLLFALNSYGTPSVAKLVNIA